MTSLGADRRSRMGIGRSYQKTNIFPEFTAFENCRLAAQSRLPRPFRVWSDASACRPHREAAERALDAAGLAGRAGQVAAALSHGEQRQLEIAMVLATEPEVLLLDEPLAGMGAEEAGRMVELLKRLAPDHAMLLVEHDMDAVFAVADVITVMVNGQVLESGTPGADPREPRGARGVSRRRSRARRRRGARRGRGRGEPVSEALLEARELHAYYGASHVLHGVDFASGPARPSASWAGTAWARPRSSGACSAS